MVANGEISTYVFLNFEKEDSNSKVIIPYSINLNDPTLEQITVKKLKSVEKGCVYPFISMSFIRACSPDNNNNPSIPPDSLGGLFECIQSISELPKGKRFRSHRIKRLEHSQDGFLIFAYKTMEDMYNTMFAASWKTWTGARLLCKMLPDRFPVKRSIAEHYLNLDTLSILTVNNANLCSKTVQLIYVEVDNRNKNKFGVRKVGKCNGFTYILMAQIENLMVDCAPALNILHYMKPKICAVVGAYRGITFKVDADMLHTLHVADEDHITGYASKLKVLYSNNSVSLEFPDYLEFRDDEEELDDQGNHVTSTSTKVMVSEETQTIIKTEGQTRRHLPRTISIYDFPSMKDIEESTLTFKPVDLNDEIIESNGIIGFVDCPIGVWRRKPQRKFGHVAFSESTLFDQTNGNFLCTHRQPTPLPTIQLNDTLGSLSPQPDFPREMSHAENAVPNENRKCVTREDSLLARLKEKYFNSPDYPREDLANN